jgi:hypothetical protein
MIVGAGRCVSFFASGCSACQQVHWIHSAAGQIVKPSDQTAEYPAQFHAIFMRTAPSTTNTCRIRTWTVRVSAAEYNVAFCLSAFSSASCGLWKKKLRPSSCKMIRLLSVLNVSVKKGYYDISTPKVVTFLRRLWNFLSFGGEQRLRTGCLGECFDVRDSYCLGSGAEKNALQWEKWYCF